MAKKLTAVDDRSAIRIRLLRHLTTVGVAKAPRDRARRVTRGSLRAPAALDGHRAPCEGAQAALIEFLRADLSLSFTMLRTAEIDRRDEPAHCEAALAKVRAALDVIRTLERESKIGKHGQRFTSEQTNWKRLSKLSQTDQ